ncbi:MULTISPECIES: tetratricopeptide repeat protein [Alloalcanivorax]|jgi:tetratricopeptide (TPR) repeat protein|uniref:tetratricopeptide repeat protein n=2 Tax=Alcanivoracaceae TaxID=224372 RepID=UPI000A84CEC2
MRVMPWRRWLLLFLLVCGPVGAQQNRAEDPAEGPVESQSEIEKGPVISQFRENWILGELRSLRQDMMEYRNDMNRIVTDRELEVADKAMGYATNTVTYFFYLIAGAASILALVGWSTIRDLKDNIRVYAEKEMSRLTVEYESRLADLEQELRRKSRTITENQEEIERTNEIHSLWLKATKETSYKEKIELYDRILELRPDDPEALAWKADAALELGEQRWALSLCDRVLEVDEDNAHALYQRACAWAGLGETENALRDLRQAVAISEALRQHARAEEMFVPLREMERFQELVGRAEDDETPL